MLRLKKKKKKKKKNAKRYENFEEKEKTRRSNNQKTLILKKKVIKDDFAARTHTLRHSLHQKSAYQARYRQSYFKVLNETVSIIVA